MRIQVEPSCMDEETPQKTDAAPESGASWLETMRRAANSLLADERVSKALETTKQAASAGGRTVASGLDKARGQFTQEEAWHGVEETLEDLVDVIRVQHAKIQELTSRVDALEANRDHG